MSWLLASYVLCCFGIAAAEAHSHGWRRTWREITEDEAIWYKSFLLLGAVPAYWMFAARKAWDGYGVGALLAVGWTFGAVAYFAARFL